MYWEFYQQSKIQDAKSTASRAEGRAQTVDYRVRALEGKVDALALTCQALWELIRDRTALTEQDLEQKVAEIDLRDGRQDGRMGAAGGSCPRCGRALNRRHARCMYCGEEVGKDHAFQS